MVVNTYRYNGFTDLQTQIFTFKLYACSFIFSDVYNLSMTLSYIKTFVRNKKRRFGNTFT